MSYCANTGGGPDDNRAAERTAPTACSVLPASLLQLDVDRLSLAEPLAENLRTHGVVTVGDLLSLPPAVLLAGAWLGPAGAADLRETLGNLLRGGLGPFDAGEAAAASTDWLTVAAQLRATLTADEAELLEHIIGLHGAATSLAEIARRPGRDLLRVEAMADSIRICLHERLPSLLCALRHETGRELAALGGVIDAEQLGPGSMLQTLGHGAADPLVPLRLVAFCFPHDLHLVGHRLVGTSPRSFRRLRRKLLAIVQPHRLPLTVDTLLADLRAVDAHAPRGLVLHLLRTELNVPIEIDGDRGEIAMPDPRSPSARLADLLAEVGRPMAIDELVYAYRERFRRASQRSIEQRLRRDPTFLMVGPAEWSLRNWHREDLLAASPLVDKVARRICTEGGKQKVARLLADDDTSALTIWMVLDGLAQDPRVRLLGRGEACPATHKRSQVLDQLLHDFRCASGDVVLSLFVQNQSEAHRRLVRRLLHENRLFVMPSPDRIDALSNYPFNEERLRRLVELVGRQLDERAGYAHASALKVVVDRTDLGGGWLTPMLLADLMRRHGPFEVLPAGVIGQRSLGLGMTLMRTVRQALRGAGSPVSIEEILRARPELAEFGACLEELLAADPLVQTPDGSHFTLV